MKIRSTQALRPAEPILYNTKYVWPNEAWQILASTSGQLIKDAIVDSYSNVTKLLGVDLEREIKVSNTYLEISPEAISAIVEGEDVSLFIDSSGEELDWQGIAISISEVLNKNKYAAAAFASGVISTAGFYDGLELLEEFKYGE
jgi:hypothetical protein